MQKFVRILKNLLHIHPELQIEAFTAYYHRLPNKIKVGWFRDGDFIIGEIDDGEHKFKTQAKNTKAFIDMVNDAIYTMHDIPEDYIDELSRIKAYTPTSAELEKLSNKNIKSSLFNLNRKKELQVA